MPDFCWRRQEITFAARRCVTLSSTQPASVFLLPPAYLGLKSCLADFQRPTCPSCRLSHPPEAYSHCLFALKQAFRCFLELPQAWLRCFQSSPSWSRLGQGSSSALGAASVAAQSHSWESEVSSLVIH